MQCPDGTKPDAASVSCQAVGGGGGGGDGGFAFLELIIGIVIGVGVALLLFRTFGSRQQIGVDSTQPQAQAPKPAAPPPSSAASSPSSFQQPVAVQQVAPPPTMTSVNPLQNSIEAESSIADPAQFLRGRRLAAATAAVDDEDV
jgi:predicted lipid-binding transport protein (Tim44 family)